MRTVYDADLLLVDDNPDLLRLLSDQLSGAGYRHIRTAANCAAAQTAFACKTPELMILDIPTLRIVLIMRLILSEMRQTSKRNLISSYKVLIN